MEVVVGMLKSLEPKTQAAAIWPYGVPPGKHTSCTSPTISAGDACERTRGKRAGYLLRVAARVAA
jgi:hypothetical protein